MLNKQTETFYKLCKTATPEDCAIVFAYYQAHSGEIASGSKDGRQWTVVHHAASQGNYYLVALLLLLGLSLNTKTAAKTCNTTLDLALKKKHNLTAKMIVLLSKTAFTTCQSEKKLTEFSKSLLTLSTAKNLEFTLNEKSMRQTKADLIELMAAIHLTLNLSGQHARWKTYLSNNKLLRILFNTFESSSLKPCLDNHTATQRHITTEEKPKHRQINTNATNTPGLTLDPQQQIMPFLRSGKLTEDYFVELIENINENIIYHSELRIQFAFYLMVFYYRSQHQIRLTQTQHQNQQGIKYTEHFRTEAAHCALISHFKEDFRHPTTDDSKKTGSKCVAIKPEDQLLPENAYFRHLLAGTTNILPQAINAFDKVFEGTVNNPKPARRTLLLLVNELALGKTTPINAFQFFIIRLLTEIKNLRDDEDYLSQASKSSPEKIKLPILRAIRRGIVRVCEDVTIAMEKPLQAKVSRQNLVNLLFIPSTQRQDAMDANKNRFEKMAESQYAALQQQMRTTPGCVDI